MEGKKISFGFMKTKKADKPVVEEKKEYIESIDEKAIKVVGGETVKEDKPLVIPMKPNTLITAERLREIAEKVEKDLEEPIKVENPTEEIKPSQNETLEQMAVRELLQESKKEVKVDTETLTLAVAGKPVSDGKESTLDDYESVPVQDFGMAMLRGMGWTPNKDQSKYKQPELRPKGLGLGADKVIKENQKKKGNNKEEELAIVKNSFVKITTGKYSGCYGKVVSLDEENGRVMVDIPIKNETVSLSEFMMYAVSKSEYDKEWKVINADSFEEYKRTEKSQKPPRNDSPKVNDREASSSQKYEESLKERREDSRKDCRDSNGKNKDRNRRRDSSSGEDRSRHKKKDKKRYSSNDSLSSLSEDEKKKKHKSRRKHSNGDSSDDDRKGRRRKSKTPEGKRDIDKKRKGKKKKRDRDRSPSYKKYRK